jgi:Polymorphic toxin system, DSP-PTPase phosphatase
MARPRGGDWLGDETALLREAGTDVLVSMLTASELRELELGEEPAAATDAGMRFIELPAPDRGTPDLRAFRAVVAELTAELALGHAVVVHCRMGIGRSSLVAAGVLVAQRRTRGRRVGQDQRFPRARCARYPRTAELAGPRHGLWLIIVRGRSRSSSREPERGRRRPRFVAMYGGPLGGDEPGAWRRSPYPVRCEKVVLSQGRTCISTARARQASADSAPEHAPLPPTVSEHQDSLLRQYYYW